MSDLLTRQMLRSARHHVRRLDRYENDDDDSREAANAITALCDFVERTAATGDARPKPCPRCEARDLVAREAIELLAQIGRSKQASRLERMLKRVDTGLPDPRLVYRAP